MKKIYDEFLYVPRDGKIREKVMLTRITVSIILIITCLAAMSMTAYAYFSHTVTSNFNIIKAADFEITISAVDLKNNNPVEIQQIEKSKYQVGLSAGTYSFKVESTGTAETGFCVLSASGCDKVYHTQQIGIANSTDKTITPIITFNIEVENTTTITLISHWGTSSYYDAYKNKGEKNELYITNNKSVLIPVVAEAGGSDATVSSSSAPSEEENSQQNTETSSQVSNQTSSQQASGSGISDIASRAANILENANSSNQTQTESNSTEVSGTTTKETE